MICPSCLMFDAHRGHPVEPIDQGAKGLRARINAAAKEGVLKFERTESILLDIRHAKLSLEENQETVLRQAERYYDDLIATLKARRGHFLDELRSHFQTQIDSIDEFEDEWVRKQELSQKILKLQTSDDDMKLMEESTNVVEGTGWVKQDWRPWGSPWSTGRSSWWRGWRARRCWARRGTLSRNSRTPSGTTSAQDAPSPTAYVADHSRHTCIHVERVRSSIFDGSMSLV